MPWAPRKRRLCIQGIILLHELPRALKLDMDGYFFFL